jgi:NAD(P)H-hydrate epimerase
MCVIRFVELKRFAHRTGFELKTNLPTLSFSAIFTRAKSSLWWANGLSSQSSTLSSLEVAILDRNSEYLGVSTLQLMENAGRSVADEISLRFGSRTRVAIFAGTGRNGGDGMAAARHLSSRGFKVLFRLVGSEKSIRDASVISNWEALKAMSTSVKIATCPDSSLVSSVDSDVVVDALLGTGVHGKLRQPYLRAVQVINSSAGFKISVDVPSGIDSDTGEVLGDAVRANLTITLHAPKRGFSRAKRYCGEVKVASIGIPPEASVIAGPGDVEAVSTRRKVDAHKGQFGRLLVIGGSEIFTGAPALVAVAAYRTGVDLVNVATPEVATQTIAAFSPSIITLKLPGSFFSSSHLKLLKKQFNLATAIVVGPGLGLSNEAVRAVRRIVDLCIRFRKPTLIDADGLKALGVVRRKVLNEMIVITPHAGEFESVSGKTPSRDLETRIEEVRGFASKSGAVTLLKGHTDIISDGTRVKLNNTGNPGMTVGGTGDVLAGIVAGLMAQGIEPYRAAVAGAFVNGAAGDFAEERFGHHIIPTDLVDFIPGIMNDPMSHKAIFDSRIRNNV